MGGKRVVTWYSKPVVHAGDTVINEVDIYFTTNNFGMPNEAASAQIVRITSPRFMTQQKIGVGSTLTQIQKYFKKIKKIGSYVSPKTNMEVSIYDDRKSGIAFEIDQQQNCVGVTVYVSGDGPEIIYNSVFGEVKYL
jgi:hypothetical protein